MRYIVIIELESVGFTSCKIQGLSLKEVTSLDNLVKSLNLPSNKQDVNFYEVDTQAIRILNILSEVNFGYRVCSQSMVIEKSSIGSREIQVQKTVWTMFVGSIK